MLPSVYFLNLLLSFGWTGSQVFFPSSPLLTYSWVQAAWWLLTSGSPSQQQILYHTRLAIKTDFSEGIWKSQRHSFLLKESYWNIRFIQYATIGCTHVKSEKGLDLGHYNATNIKKFRHFMLYKLLQICWYLVHPWNISIFQNPSVTFAW